MAWSAAVWPSWRSSARVLAARGFSTGRSATTSRSPSALRPTTGTWTTRPSRRRVSSSPWASASWPAMEVAASSARPSRSPVWMAARYFSITSWWPRETRQAERPAPRASTARLTSQVPVPPLGQTAGLQGGRAWPRAVVAYSPVFTAAARRWARSFADRGLPLGRPPLPLGSCWDRFVGFGMLTALVVRGQVESMSARPQSARRASPEPKSQSPREIGSVGAEGKWIDDRSILDDWTAYLLSVRGLAEGTVARYRRLVERLLADGETPIARIDRGLIEKHLRRLHVAGRGESVRQGVVVAVRSLGEWCLAHGIVAANPGASLSGPRPYRREIKVLSVAEVGRLLWGDQPGTLPPDRREMRDRVLLGVAYVAGLRASEIGPLEAEGVVWQEATQTFSILVRRGKGAGHDVRLPLDRVVARVLGVWLTVRAAGDGAASWGASGAGPARVTKSVVLVTGFSGEAVARKC